MATVTFWCLLACVTFLLMLTKMMRSRGTSPIEIKRREEVKDEKSAATTTRKGRRERGSSGNRGDKASNSIGKFVAGGKEGKVIGGPPKFPIIGSLHLLRGDGGPFDAFTRLAEEYGDVYEIQLGVAKCVVVSSWSMLKEVLITKGNHFGGRPDFLRFHKLFGGDRNNSLALCDWSDLQRKRRSIARKFCSPRGGSPQQDELVRIAVLEATEFLSALEQPESSSILMGERSIKPLMLSAVANMFTRYMCSTRFAYADEEFRKIVRLFDDIFWDINQGYAVDFMPWLSPFYTGHMNRLNSWTTEIRSFILRKIIDRRRASLDTVNGIPRDFTDALLLHLESPESGLSWQHIIFELEDFIGGHSAIGNLVMLVFANVAVHPEVSKKIQQECDDILSRPGRGSTTISYDDRLDMPYTEAVTWETLRVASSPIVPHVATEDTDIGGYPVSKDTVVFVNNFGLNLDEAHWGPDSREFRPERFLRPAENSNEGATFRVYKPEYFIPFSTGKRTCIGQKLVQGFAFVMAAAVISRYNVRIASDDLKTYLRPGCVAVPPDQFLLKLEPRISRQGTCET